MFSALVATSTVSATSSLAVGTLVTVATSLGTITTADADPNYAGIQVLVGAGGAFSFVVQAPVTAGTALVTAQEISGAALGSTAISITPPTNFRFDFNYLYNPVTQSTYTSVQPADTYSVARGFGWTTAIGSPGGSYYRASPAVPSMTLPDLQRDAHFDQDNTFRVLVRVTGMTQYTVTLYLGDNDIPHNQHIYVGGSAGIIDEGTTATGVDVIGSRAGGFVIVSFTIPIANFTADVNGNDILQIRLVGVGTVTDPGDNFFNLNGIDIVGAGAGPGGGSGGQRAPGGLLGSDPTGSADLVSTLVGLNSESVLAPTSTSTAASTQSLTEALPETAGLSSSALSSRVRQYPARDTTRAGSRQPLKLEALDYLFGEWAYQGGQSRKTRGIA